MASHRVVRAMAIVVSLPLVSVAEA